MEVTGPFAGEDREETRIPLHVIATSAVGFTEGRPHMVFVGDDSVDAMTDLNGKLELYKLRVDFGDAGGVMVIEDLSNTDPVDVTLEVLEVSDAASPFTDTGSGPVLPGEDSSEGET